MWHMLISRAISLHQANESCGISEDTGEMRGLWCGANNEQRLNGEALSRLKQPLINVLALKLSTMTTIILFASDDIQINNGNKRSSPTDTPAPTPVCWKACWKCWDSTVFGVTKHCFCLSLHNTIAHSITRNRPVETAHKPAPTHGGTVLLISVENPRNNKNPHARLMV